jgi:hypothetical protein
VKQTCVRVLAVLLIVLCADRAFAQSRPLVTEDPETVGTGQILVEGGVGFAKDAFYPASGLLGNLWQIGTIGFSFGLSPIAELQLDGGLHNHLSISARKSAPLAFMLQVPGDSTGDIEDAVIGAKIRFMAETERRPSMAVRFSTRLPNASNESGLGLDTTDFNFGVAVGKTVRSIRVVGNFGFGILGDPVRGDRQNDVLNYGISVARAVAEGTEVVGEMNGRLSTRSGTPPIGTESRSTMRLGARFTRGAVRLDAAFLVGVTSLDPTFGFTVGATWVFRGFKVPER